MLPSRVDLGRAAGGGRPRTYPRYPGAATRSRSRRGALDEVGKGTATGVLVALIKAHTGM
jgi:hypothetical protein